MLEEDYRAECYHRPHFVITTEHLNSVTKDQTIGFLDDWNKKREFNQ